jgi:hypothetical protein
MKTTKVIAGPYSELFTPDSVKQWLRDEDNTAQDGVLDMLIQAVREYGENYTQRSWLPKTYELSLPYFCGDKDEIELPYPPLCWVESIRYVDINGVTQTYDLSTVQVSTRREPGVIKPAYGYYWPSVRSSNLDAVVIRYVAGYLDTTVSPTDYGDLTKVPASAKLWAKHKLAQAYEHREAIVVGNIVTPLPRSEIDGFLDSMVVNLFK